MLSKGPLDFPAIEKWLKICEEDFERGRDKHEYTRLVPVFSENGCTRIDDISRMSTELIWDLSARAGVEVTIGLVNRVHQYASDDVQLVKREGKLVF